MGDGGFAVAPTELSHADELVAGVQRQSSFKYVQVR